MGCCDGLKGLPDAIGAVWPQAVTQTCVVRSTGSALKYVNSTDRKKVAAALKGVYTAVDETPPLRPSSRPEDGAVSMPARSTCSAVHPFLDFDQDIRRVIYATNAIESMKRNLRKLLKTSGHFPSDDTAMKVLYLGVRNIEPGTSTAMERSPPAAFAAQEPRPDPRHGPGQDQVGSATDSTYSHHQPGPRNATHITHSK
ncbi:transposase [Streptomyces kronopolitis]|uniref:transposase n=1 Tax=Streptomyces kronopolitis TaxID=1612435 RepID=UPI003FD6F2F7